MSMGGDTPEIKGVLRIGKLEIRLGDTEGMSVDVNFTDLATHELEAQVEVIRSSLNRIEEEIRRRRTA